MVSGMSWYVWVVSSQPINMKHNFAHTLSLWYKSIIHTIHIYDEQQMILLLFYARYMQCCV